MPVDTRHADYDRRIEQVRKIRRFIEGEGAVLEYVLRLPGHVNLTATGNVATEEQEADFKLFRERAYALPAASRTLDAYVGMLMSPEPQITEGPPALQKVIDDVDNKGEPFRRFAGRVVREVISSGRCAVLIEGPERSPGNIRRLQRERAGEVPYVVKYNFESVIDWRMEKVGGRWMLTHIRLLEDYTETVDEFTRKIKTQIRVLDLVQGKYRSRVFRRANKSIEGKGEKIVGENKNGVQTAEEWIQEGGDIFPTRGGEQLDHIPIVIFNVDSLDPQAVSKSPMSDLVEILFRHLQNSASYESALMYCGAPTPVLKGEPATDAEGNPEPLGIGSSTGIVVPVDGDFAIVGLDPSGVGALKTAMEDKKAEMVAIGARAMMTEHGSNISTDTEKVRRVGEHSVLAQVALTASDGLTKVLEELAAWHKIELPEEFQVLLNTDFLPQGLQPGELTEWIAAVQSGVMPVSVFVEKLKKRGEVDPDMTVEDFRAALDEDDFGIEPGAGDDEGDDDDDEEEEAA